MSFESVSVRSYPDDLIAMIESNRDDAEVARGAESRTDEAVSESGEVRFHLANPSTRNQYPQPCRRREAQYHDPSYLDLALS
jgi:hypothetical protein